LKGSDDNCAAAAAANELSRTTVATAVQKLLVKEIDFNLLASETKLQQYPYTVLSCVELNCAINS